MDRRIAVIGAGSWGTALASAVARRIPCMLWVRNPDLANVMAQTYTNPKYLPNIPLPDLLHFESNTEKLWKYVFDSQTLVPPLLILGVPVAGLEQACKDIVDAVNLYQRPVQVVWTCKGIDPEKSIFPHQIAQQVFGNHPHIQGGVLAGPSFAKEVAQQLPVALVVGSQQKELMHSVTAAFHSESVRMYHHTDMIGIEVGGALKNIIAVACGISDGLGLGMNARAALITRGLSEMTRFGTALGAHPNTFQGLTGLGDLVLTCTGDLSRNRSVGQLLAKGLSLGEILSQMQQVAEGVRCTAAACQISQKLKVEMPITQAIHAVLEGRASPMDMVHQLMLRSPKQED